MTWKRQPGRTCLFQGRWRKAFALARCRDQAGLGEEGNPTGTNLMDDAEKSIYTKALQEHMSQRMSPAGLRLRGKRLDETDAEYDADKTTFLDYWTITKDTG